MQYYILYHLFAKMCTLYISNISKNFSVDNFSTNHCPLQIPVNHLRYCTPIQIQLISHLLLCHTIPVQILKDQSIPAVKNGRQEDINLQLQLLQLNPFIMQFHDQLILLVFPVFPVLNLTAGYCH